MSDFSSRSNPEGFLAHGFGLIGRVRVWFELVEEELRQESTFTCQTLRSWRELSQLARATAEPLDFLLGAYPDNIDGATRIAFANSLHFFQRQVLDAVVYLERPVPDHRRGVCNPEQETLKKIYDALAKITRARFSLKYWQIDLGRNLHKSTQIAITRAIPDPPITTAGVASLRILQALQGLQAAIDDGAAVILDSTSRCVFLTWFFLAVAQPSLFGEELESRVLRTQAAALRVVPMGMANQRMHQRWELFQELTREAFLKRSLSI